MTRSGERDLSRIGGIDYALMTVGSCLSAFGGCMTIAQPSIGLFCILCVVVGATFSYGARTALLRSRSKLIKLDGYLYALGVVAAFIFGTNLQALMPEGGFPTDVIAAGWLSWMLIFGSFFTWQDSTLLFQAIPSIALFGLAGVYDVFRGVTFAFFGFLLCLATLFGRAHRRAMLLQAAESGYFTRGLAPGAPVPSVETTTGLARKMEEGPWRWVAGPEWALFGALAVVGLSILGAPVLRLSLKPVSKFVIVPIPRSVQRASRVLSNPITGTTADVGNTVVVGQGPNKTLSKDPVFEITMPDFNYLRMAWFNTYRGRDWQIVLPAGTDIPEGEANAVAIAEMKQMNSRQFSVWLRRPMRLLPVPGTATDEWPGRTQTQTRPDGSIQIVASFSSNFARPITRTLGSGSSSDATSGEGSAIIGKYAEPAGGPPTDAQTDLPEIFQGTQARFPLSDRVKAFVQTAIKGARNDYEKAEMIREAIARRIEYNLDATAVPVDAEPVDYTLFEHPEAYCDLYATCMTLLAREAGIPARFVVGYLPDASLRDSAGRYVVLDSDYHAWSELYFKDFGWVVFDATDGANSVPGEGRGTANVPEPFFERAWVKATIDALIGVLFVAAAVVLLRMLKTRAKARTVQTELASAYRTFAQMLEKTTRTRREMSWSPDEFVQAVREKLGKAYPAVAQVNDRFVRLMFARGDVTAEDVSKIRADVRSLSRVLKEVAAQNRHVGKV